jgi:serine/threonine-protein kinase
MEEDQDEALARARVGTSLAGWQLDRVLGVGGMGSVFLGRRADGAVAAVKILHARYCAVEPLRKRFLREGPLGSALSTMGPLCEGLPQIYESGLAPDGTAYLVMEVLDGETVFDRMARERVLPVDQVLWMAHKVLDVLAVAHAYGIIHRDLKPENLHLGRDGRFKVLDFGVARVTDTLPEYVGVLPEQTRTQTGTALGSCEYMPPEQAIGNNKEVDGRTDLFGLGATMYRLLSGHAVHGDREGGNLLIAAATEPVPPLASVAPHLLAPICAVVDRALAFAKKERYPDAATMRFDVIALRNGREPPYVAAVAFGRIRPGEGLFGAR